MAVIRSATRRRSRYALLALTLLVAASLGAGFAIALGGRYHMRFDLTSTREHTLSGRTQELLVNLDGDHTIIVAARMQQIDGRALQRLRDLLDAYTEASDNLSVFEINLNAPDAPDRADEVVRMSMRHHEVEIEAHVEALGTAETTLEQAAVLAERCAALAEQLGGRLAPGELRRTWSDNASALAALPGLAREAREVLREHQQTNVIGTIQLPTADAALQRISQTLTTLDITLGSVMTLSDRTIRERSGEDAELARSILNEARLARDATLRTGDDLARLGALDPLSVARVLLAQEAVLLLGPVQTTAVNFETLLPAAGNQSQGPPLRSTAESLISSALAASADPTQPVLVLVHAEPVNLLEANGQLRKGAEQLIGALYERLRRDRIDIREWPVSLFPMPPDRSEMGVADADTPVVWFVLGAPGSGELGERIERRDRLANSILRLVESGESILLTINPSELPAIGEADPLIGALPLFAMESDSGRLLIQRVNTQQGPVPGIDFVLRSGASDNPISLAVDGLPTYIRAATALHVLEDAPDGARAWAILEVPESSDTWAMAAWQSMLRTGIARVQQPDPDRDDAEGPWPVVMAGERPNPIQIVDEQRPLMQRMVAVSAQGWYADATTQSADLVNGETVKLYPGNDELFDASFAWLAGLDDRIGSGASGGDIARIDTLNDPQILAIRWALIAGLPVLVLVCGIAYRWLSG